MLRRARSGVGFALLLVVAAVLPSPAIGPASAGSVDFSIQRVAGADRYATAAAISRRFFTPGVAVAFVVTGANFPDGLTAGPAAARLGGPVLYVGRDAVPTATLGELRRLVPGRIVVVGSTGVISESVRAKLAELALGGAQRVAGMNRYATAAAVSRAFFASAATVYVATGEGFPDGLAAGAAATARAAPVLLVRRDSVPAATAAELARLRPSQIVLAGGIGVISSAVEAALRSFGASVTRAGGGDRYETAVALSRSAFASPTSAAFIVTGVAFPDALAGIAAVGRQRGPILLVLPGVLPASVSTELARLKPATAYVLGGTGAVGVPVVKAVQRLLGVCWSAYRPPAGATQFLSSVPSATGRIALTFDMGGRLDPAIAIIKQLIDQQVCATLFPTGSASQTTTGRQVLALIAAHPELFEVGNHTMHHCDLVTGEQSAGSPYCPTTRPSGTFVVKELTDAAGIIRDFTQQNPQPYWRAPFGASDAGVRAAAASAGYTKTIQWSIDTIDWSAATTSDLILSRVLSKASSGAIVLMHLGGYHTADALPTLIQALRQRGYTLTTLSDMLD